MGVTFGFYNSVNHDRLYSTVEISKMFDGLINDGIFASIGTAMMVTPGSGGMYVVVGVGRAWFNHTWTYNDTPLILATDLPDMSFTRIDAVVLEINAADDVRANSIKIIPGTPALVPERPTLINSGTLHQYPLGWIDIPIDLADIEGANITNAVGTTPCPFVTGPLETIDAGTLFSSWQSEFEIWFAAKQSEETATMEGLESDFNIWFDEMKDQLSTDAAGHLQNEIDHAFRVVARQGGTSLDWDVPNNPLAGPPDPLSNYDVLASEESVTQVGTVRWEGSAEYHGNVIVTFPHEFAHRPVTVVSVAGVSAGIVPIIPQVIPGTTASFAIGWMSADMTATKTFIDFEWIAVGPLA